MTLVHRGSLVFVVALNIGAAITSPSFAQKYLGYARGSCSGTVTIADTGVAVKNRGTQIYIPKTVAAPAAGVAVRWECDGVLRPVLECPAGTGKILFDRTRGGALLTITCLKN